MFGLLINAYLLIFLSNSNMTITCTTFALCVGGISIQVLKYFSYQTTAGDAEPPLRKGISVLRIATLKVYLLYHEYEDTGQKGFSGNYKTMFQNKK